MTPTPGRPTDWGLSDEWFTDFITDLQASPRDDADSTGNASSPSL